MLGSSLGGGHMHIFAPSLHLEHTSSCPPGVDRCPWLQARFVSQFVHAAVMDPQRKLMDPQ